MSKLYSVPKPTPSGGGLYANTARNAAAESSRVIANSMGLNKANANGLSDALIRDVTDKLVALSEPLHLDSHELADLNRIIASHMVELAQGKDTSDKTARWADAALADLKTRHVSMRRVNQVVADCNAWLKAEHPGVHQALKNSAGLGNHPRIVRLLTDRFLAAESERARAQRGSKPLLKPAAPTAAAPNAAGGGLMSGEVSSTALAALDRRPLGTPDAA
jgi:hypothetical protein